MASKAEDVTSRAEDAALKVLDAAPEAFDATGEVEDAALKRGEMVSLTLDAASKGLDMTLKD